MCGRYTLFDSKGLSQRFKLKEKPLLHVDSNYNVAPGQFMPIVTRGEHGNQAELMKWGWIPVWAKDINIGYKLINARAESLFAKPMWKSAALHHRCLVPANGFYEWKVRADGKTKQPFYIHPTGQDLFAFAGLWSTWKDVEGKELRSFTIVTTDANKAMAKVHNRMPVMLTPEVEAAWLDPKNDEPDLLAECLKPYAGKLEIYPVSPDVNTPRNNRKNLIYQLDESS